MHAVRALLAIVLSITAAAGAKAQSRIDVGYVSSTATSVGVSWETHIPLGEKPDLVFGEETSRDARLWMVTVKGCVGYAFLQDEDDVPALGFHLGLLRRLGWAVDRIGIVGLAATAPGGVGLAARGEAMRLGAVNVGLMRLVLDERTELFVSAEISLALIKDVF